MFVRVGPTTESCSAAQGPKKSYIKKLNLLRRCTKKKHMWNEKSCIPMHASPSP
jgi:hypothetical protein